MARCWRNDGGHPAIATITHEDVGEGKEGQLPASFASAWLLPSLLLEEQWWDGEFVVSAFDNITIGFRETAFSQALFAVFQY